MIYSVHGENGPSWIQMSLGRFFSGQFRPCRHGGGTWILILRISNFDMLLCSKFLDTFFTAAFRSDSLDSRCCSVVHTPNICYTKGSLWRTRFLGALGEWSGWDLRVCLPAPAAATAFWNLGIWESSKAKQKQSRIKIWHANIVARVLLSRIKTNSWPLLSFHIIGFWFQKITPHPGVNKNMLEL